MAHTPFHSVIMAATLALCAPRALDPVARAQPGAHVEPATPTARLAPVALGDIGRRIAAAAPGETVRVPAGVHHEHLRIDKPISLIAEPGAILDGGGSGDIVEITAPDVTLRGFTIRNTGIDLDQENAAIRALAPRVTIEDNVLDDVLFGIDLREAPDSRVVGNRIGGKRLDIARRGDGLRLWRCDGAVIERNTLHSGRDAIIWYSNGVVVRENSASDCRYGLHLMFSDDVAIVDNHFARNSVGIYLMYSAGVEIARNRLVQNRGPSGYGVGLKETDRFVVRDNLFAANRSGVYIDGSPFTAAQPGVFSGNTLAHNDVGFTFLPSARGNELVGNNFIDNIDQIAVAGRGGLGANAFWKGDRGNYWSDYSGYDQNADGVGDFVHESHTLFENLMDRQPALRLFLFSPAQQAVEFVGRAIPAVRPEPKFTDEVPLMRPVEVRPAPPPAGAAPLGLAAAGAPLVALGAGLIAFAVGPRRAWRASLRAGGIA